MSATTTHLHLAVWARLRQRLLKSSHRYSGLYICPLGLGSKRQLKTVLSEVGLREAPSSCGPTLNEGRKEQVLQRIKLGDEAE